MFDEVTLFVENSRNEEKKKAILEIDRVKQSYEEKQRETMNDLIELEAIHNKRIQDNQQKLNERDQDIQRYRKRLVRVHEVNMIDCMQVIK